MKYLFLINSHTTFLSSIGTINYLKIKREDAILLYMRNYTNSLFDIKYLIFNVDELITKCSDPNIWKRTIQKKMINSVDLFLDEIINDDQFKFYSPHFAHPFTHIVYTNKRCIEGAFIQEGGIPFRNTYLNKLSFFEKIKYAIKNNLYLRSNRIWYPRTWYCKGRLYKQNKVESYAISDAFFKFLESHNNIINWPRCSVNIEIKKNSMIFIFDGFVKHGLVEKDIYIDVCKKMIKERASTINYLRFHPAQTDDEKELIIKCFSDNGLNYEVMDTSVPFEMIICNLKNLKVCGMGSSLLYFSQEFGHEVYCYDEILEKSELYRSYKQKENFMGFKQTFGLN